MTVYAVGGPAARALSGVPGVIALVGDDGDDTLALAAAAAGRGWPAD